MNCEKARSEIFKEDLHRGDLPARLEGHLRECPNCARVAFEARALARTLSELERPRLPPGFEQRLKARIEDIHAHKKRRRFWGRIAAVPAAAALAATLLVTTLKLAERPTPPVTSVRYAEIELIVEAGEPVPAVNLSLLLPEGVEPFRAGETATRKAKRPLRTFRWADDLAKGENRYHLPVAVSGCGSYEVQAVLATAKDRVEAILTMEVSTGGLNASFSAACLPTLSGFSFHLVSSTGGTFENAGS